MARPWILRRRTHFSSEEAPVSVSREETQYPMGMHRHEFVEIVVILGGWGLHATGSLRHEIRQGDVMVIHGRRSHAYEKTRALSLVNVLLQEQFLEDTARVLGGLPGYHPLFTFEFVRWEKKEFSGRLHLKPAELKKVCEWIDAMELECRERTPWGNHLASLWAVQLMAFLARRYGTLGGLDPELDVRLGQVLDKMDREPLENPRVAEMAAAAGMSERSFLRYFRKATGFSPTDYLIRGRIHQAAELLLKDRAVRVTDVALRCGFNDSNYFSRQFSRVMGQAPREYRAAPGLAPH